jgi:hypothetical protein
VSTYRCFCTTADNRIITGAQITADSLPSAVEVANERWRTVPEFRSIEVWLGRDRTAGYTKRPEAHGQPRAEGTRRQDNAGSERSIRITSEDYGAATVASSLHELTSFYLGADCLAPQCNGERSFFAVTELAAGLTRTDRPGDEPRPLMRAAGSSLLVGDSQHTYSGESGHDAGSRNSEASSAAGASAIERSMACSMHR